MNMNSPNLIRLGAYAQQLFDLPNDFKIMFLPDDYPGTDVRLAITFAELTQDPRAPRGVVEWDVVQLQRWGSTDNYETVRAAYSKRTNTLVIAGSL